MHAGSNNEKVNSGKRQRIRRQILTTTGNTGSLLPRQPDPNPIDSVSPSTPSLILYGLLLCLAVIFIFVSFKLGSPDWSSFFSNISAELFGAVLILLLVERRFRMSEIRYLKGVKQDTITYIMFSALGLN